jgi:predicted nucleic acid-binding protein
MPYYVVDASVVAKWVLPDEEYQENTIKLKKDRISRIAELSAPSFIVQEVANALWRAVKLQRFSKENAQEALIALDNMQIELYPFSWIQSSQELDIACKLNIAIYDAAYLLLAEKTKTQLITADNKLYEKAKNNYKVLHIKDYV